MKVALLGQSRTGKGTLLKGLQEEYGYPLVSVGTAYRAAACYLSEKYALTSEEEYKDSFLDAASIVMNVVNGIAKINEEEYDLDVLRSSANTLLTEVLCQRDDFLKKVLTVVQPIQEVDLLMDGRNISVPFLPSPDIKFQLTATIEERAKRRMNEECILKNSTQQSLSDLICEIESNDAIENSKHGDIFSNESVIIDTTNMTELAVLEYAKSHIDNKLCY